MNGTNSAMTGAARLGLLFAISAGAALTGGCDTSWLEPSPVGGPGAGTPTNPDAGGPLSGPLSTGGEAGIAPPVPPSMMQPLFGATVAAKVAPPPISGGTLLVTRNGSVAVAADPDRDAIYVVDLAKMALAFTIALHPGDEPGRLVEDGAGRVHIALRGGGALVAIDPATGTLVGRRPVCPAPRGVAWVRSSDVVWVACATGELVGLPSAGGAATRQLVLERDLRDVVVSNGSLAVSKFRSAQMLRVASDGTITRRDDIPPPAPSFVPHVAWRTVAGPSGSLVIVHQAETTASLSTQIQGGYGGASGGVGSEAGAVLSVLTIVAGDGTSLSQTFPGVLPVDVALSPDGSTTAVVAPGNAFVHQLAKLFLLPGGASSDPGRRPQTLGDNAQPIAVAFDAANHVLVQEREPAQLRLLKLPGGDSLARISLSSISRDDTGHDVFHTQAGGSIACASCHPEGGDDGHRWILDEQLRRTPSLRGTIAGTAPYHWPGDMADLNALVNDVYTRRMSGAPLAGDQMSALQSWVRSIPAPPAPTWVDSSAAQRGLALFNRPDVACSTCHSGPKLTNNATVDVGTGGKFQVPPLVGVGWRTPLLHDGCAASIGDRFGQCGSTTHGSTASLTAQDVTDLTAYLETL
jgi:hypothetical protein